MDRRTALVALVLGAGLATAAHWWWLLARSRRDVLAEFERRYHEAQRDGAALRLLQEDSRQEGSR